MVIKGDGFERLYIGRLIADPKVSTFGEKQYTKTRFTVRYGERDNDIINVETVFELADRCKELKKFDNVIVVGKLDNWTDKEGKKRWFLSAELVTADISVLYRAFSKTVPEAPQIQMEGFTEVETNDEGLPF